IGVSRQPRKQVHVDDRAAGQYQVIIRERLAFAARADITDQIALQVEVSDLRRQPCRSSHHPAARDGDVQWGEGTPYHFGKHRGEEKMIIAADERDLDLGGKFPLKVLSKRHAAEPAAYDNYPSCAHDLIFYLSFTIRFGKLPA